jgi:ABC-2 type transport system permease protein
MPLSRPAITAGKLIALVGQALPVPIATAFCVLAGRGFDLRIDAGPLLGATAGVALLGLLFGTLALLIGAFTGSRGTALGLTSAAAGNTYLIDSFAPNVHWLHPARYTSPFFYAVGDNQLQAGLSLGWAAILVITTLVFALAAVLAFNRLDVH